MKLYFILEGRRGPQVPGPIMTAVFDILNRRGFLIDVAITEHMVLRPELLTVHHDLYLLKSDTELALSTAGILHAQGAQILNPYPCCVAVKDKIIASQRLRAANIPTPRSWVTGDLALMRPLVEQFPLIIKPYRGFHGWGIHIVHNPSELATVPTPENPVLIQEFIKESKQDLKIYVVGDEVFATCKPFSSTSFAQPGRPHPLTDEVRNIAVRCGQVFGLGLYGLDIIEGPTGPVVVDVNCFPGYKGVPHAPSLLADYIEEYTRGRYDLDLSKLDEAKQHNDQVHKIIESPPSYKEFPKSVVPDHQHSV